MTFEDQSLKPTKRVRSRPEPRNAQRKPPDRGPESSINRFHVLYVIVSALVICAMLALALSTIDLGGLFSDDDNSANIQDPNADLLAEQQTVVAEHPDDVDEIVLLANLLGNTGQIQEAIPWYEKALELEPGDTGIRLDFARSLAGAGLQTDAEAQFLKVLGEEPDNQTAHYYLAELYMIWSPPRESEAMEHYQEAADLDPESFLGERARNRLDTMAPSASPGSPASSPEIPGP